MPSFDLQDLSTDYTSTIFYRQNYILNKREWNIEINNIF